MLRAQQPLNLRKTEERRQKPLCDFLRKQAVAVLGECRRIENPLVDRKPDKPAKQQVELDPFDQLPLRADRIEKLQQRRPKQALRRNGRAAKRLVKRRKRPVEISERRVGQSPHRPQRMPGRNTPLDVDVREQCPTRPILAPHRSLANHLTNPRESCEKNKHQRLLGRLFQQPASAYCERSVSMASSVGG